ncbi:hypothetical protein Anapl_03800 [Anas platyrhynchos]|uniref:Uncharacterized protein n=1 Tax=Anas platyrhynchos TaxID=8839 RepID=R0KBT9_ANAPL|nr:hypothetical protein Anapl_03800 [Anas platyrhynchos]
MHGLDSAQTKPSERSAPEPHQMCSSSKHISARCLIDVSEVFQFLLKCQQNSLEYLGIKGATQDLIFNWIQTARRKYSPKATVLGYQKAIKATATVKSIFSISLSVNTTYSRSKHNGDNGYGVPLQAPSFPYLQLSALQQMYMLSTKTTVSLATGTTEQLQGQKQQKHDDNKMGRHKGQLKAGELNESLESNTALETHTGVTWRAAPPEDGEMSAVLPARSVGRN